MGRLEARTGGHAIALALRQQAITFAHSTGLDAPGITPSGGRA